MKRLRIVAFVLALTISWLGSNSASAGETVSFGTAATGGAFYAIGAGMGDVINTKSSFLHVLVQSTKGANENLQLINEGEMDLAFSASSSLYAAYHKIGDYASRELTNISSIMGLHYAQGHMLARKSSGINSYADLAGKKVCTGTNVADIYEACEAIMLGHGVDPKKDATVFHLAQDEASQKLSDGDIDAMFIWIGAPAAMFSNLMVSGEYVLVQADEKIIEKVCKENLPHVMPGLVKAGTYTGVDNDIHCVANRSMIFCNPKLSDDVVYEFCKQVVENWDAVKLSHSVLGDVELKNIADQTIPMHPGALKYFKEIGFVK
ncbi:MAG: TAXI family TRAP transporter solute-binding subunit [Synergistaceae bacterium]|jgi:TRAP transporter TAXI family solute receptor|nr:TAXI family TRAP transporter solute-binding subunit [Synergistaceae bacterium]